MESEVISIRIKRGSRKRLKELGINTSEQVRVYLEELAWRKEAKKTIDELTIMIKKYSKPPKAGFAVKSIREDRDEGH